MPPVRIAIPFAVDGRQLHQADRARRRVGVRRGTSTPGRSRRRAAPGRASRPARARARSPRSGADSGCARTTAGSSAPRRTPPPASTTRTTSESCDDASHRVRSSITDATNASSSSSEPRVDVGVVGARDLLLVGKEPLLALLHRDVRARPAHVLRRGDDDHLVEARLAARLVEQRHLGHADPRRVRELPELLAPGGTPPRRAGAAAPRATRAARGR